MGVVNPDGTHSLYDLDNSWLHYLKSDREERKRMCEDALAVEATVCLVFFVIGTAGLIYALCKGWL